jgi:hypothetical protein
MAQKKLNVFDALSSINVNEKTEKKDNLTYLSWAWAWQEFQKVCPTATYQILKNESGLPYFSDESGAMVYTKVTVDEITHEMWLPVMDGKNKAMKTKPYTYQTKFGEKTVQAYTMFDINKAIMRCLTKNLAMFGLGIYIYAGEDIPEGYEPPAPVKPKLDTKRLNGALESIKNGNYTYDKLMDTFELTEAQVKKADKFIKELQEAEAEEKELETENK